MKKIIFSLSIALTILLASCNHHAVTPDTYDGGRVTIPYHSNIDYAHAYLNVHDSTVIIYKYGTDSPYGQPLFFQ